MELLVLALCCLVLAVIVGVLGTIAVPVIFLLFREQGRLRADLDRLDEVVAELGEIMKGAAEPTKEQR
jgi:hypothetical protein